MCCLAVQAVIELCLVHCRMERGREGRGREGERGRERGERERGRCIGKEEEGNRQAQGERNRHR